MSKSPDAFRTISEVAEWLDTPAHVLRFWESKFTQVKPVKRAGGRRYYRPDDMALLAGIKILLHEQGLTIKGAQKLLREKGVKYVSGLGSDHRTDGDGAGSAEIIDLRPSQSDTGEVPQPNEPKASETTGPSPAVEAPPKRVEPLAWDPDDPWPADPAPSSEDGPRIEPLAPSEGVAFFSSGADEDAATAPDDDPSAAASPTDRIEAPAEALDDVPLPFVRSRQPTSGTDDTGPALTPEEDAGGWTAPTPPDLPDILAIPARPGALSDLLMTPRKGLARQSQRIAPLAARLAAVAERISAADR